MDLRRKYDASQRDLKSVQENLERSKSRERETRNFPTNVSYEGLPTGKSYETDDIRVNKMHF